jgi:hypothetical protein
MLPQYKRKGSRPAMLTWAMTASSFALQGMFISRLPRLREDAPPGRAQSNDAGRREKDHPGYPPLPAAATNNQHEYDKMSKTGEMSERWCQSVHMAVHGHAECVCVCVCVCVRADSKLA